MTERGIFGNLFVLFALLPFTVLAFWWFIRLVNWSTGTNIRKVMETIYSDPIAAAIYRSTVFITIGLIVIAIFARWV